MARLSHKVDFGAKDGPADLIFFIAAPDGADQEHLKLLSKLARSLIKKDFTAALRAAATEQDIVDLVDGALADKPAAAPAEAAPAAAAAPAGKHDDGCRPQAHRGRDGLPHGHRAHVHGGRFAGCRRQGNGR